MYTYYIVVVGRCVCCVVVVVVGCTLAQAFVSSMIARGREKFSSLARLIESIQVRRSWMAQGL